MRKKTWCAYAAFQVLGEICQWSWPSTYSAIGPVLWGGAFFLLLPGNLVGGYLIERFFWRSGFGPRVHGLGGTSPREFGGPHGTLLCNCPVDTKGA